MKDLKEISTEDLLEELQSRGAMPTTCPSCGKWPLYYGCSDSWVPELHCHGCRKPFAKCTCSK